MKTSVKRGIADIGLLLLRLGLGLDLAYHGAQKLFGWPIGGWFTTPPGAAESAVQDLAATTPARMTAFAGKLNGMGVPYPEISAWVAACTEFAGGLLVAVGLLTRFGALGLAIAMGVACALAHPASWDSRAQGMELPAMLCCMALALVFTGPGRVSLDALFFKSRDPYDD